jgi:asparagine synthase (glutamine-hydrolysing)
MLGFANLAITPESIYESLPLRDEKQVLLFTAAVRLDNRDELCDLFRIPASKRATLPDSELVMHAWRKWGEGAPAHLFGDWAFAVWDSRKRSLFLARDQLGNTGLYYFHRPPFFAFSSDPEALFALPHVERRMNENRIASYLSFFSLGHEDDTCWMDIRRLPSGFSLTITPCETQQRRYWNIEDVPALELGSDDDYLAGFLEHFRAAVKSRLRSRFAVGSTLSAGLDSGSVTALAAEALKSEGRTLTAFTSVPLFPADHLVPGALADEWPLASTVAARYANIEHCAVDAASVTPLNGIERSVRMMRQPMHAAANKFWILSVHELAGERGVGVMLNGQLGNGGVSWSGGRDRIFYLFASGKWDEGMKAMARWKRHHGRSWFRTVAGRLVKPLVHPYLERGRRMVKSSPRPWSEYAAINPDFASRIGLLEAMKSADHDPTFPGPMEPFEERRLTLIRNGTGAGPLWHLFGAAFRMDVRDPTADVRLLEYCLGVPPEQDTYGGGERMLIRRAMEGLLPPEVQWNRVRGRQAADVALRLLDHGDEMNAVLRRLGANLEVSRYLDVELMSRTWTDLQAKITPRTSLRASTLLLRGVMCGCFIEDAGRMRS